MRWLFVLLGMTLMSVGTALALQGAYKEAAMVGCTGAAIIAVVLCVFGPYWPGVLLLTFSAWLGLQFKDYPAADAKQIDVRKVWEVAR